MILRRILFIGLGGAGQRHLRIFRQLLGKDVQLLALRSTYKTPLLNADFTVDTSKTIAEQYGLTEFESIHQALAEKPEVVVISTPTSLHMEYAIAAANSGAHLFVEKPFSHNLHRIEELLKACEQKNRVVFTGFQRRFHELFQKTRELLKQDKIGKILNVHFNVCSYVPNWHKYENFRELYACRADLGGGALLTEIHEIDLCIWFFGMPRAVLCTAGNYSEVTMDVEDTAHIQLQYNDFCVSLSICFMQPNTQRNFYIAGSKGCIEWSESNNLLQVRDDMGQTNTYTADNFQMNQLFVDQISKFLTLENYSATDTRESINSVVLVEAAKKSNRLKKLVELPDN